MNWIYTAVYFADLARLVLVLCGVFGFSFSMNKGCLAGGFLTMLCGAAVTLLLRDPSKMRARIGYDKKTKYNYGQQEITLYGKKDGGEYKTFYGPKIQTQKSQINSVT